MPLQIPPIAVEIAHPKSTVFHVLSIKAPMAVKLAHPKSTVFHVLSIQAAMAAAQAPSNFYPQMKMNHA